MNKVYEMILKYERYIIENIINLWMKIYFELNYVPKNIRLYYTKSNRQLNVDKNIYAHHSFNTDNYDKLVNENTSWGGGAADVIST